MKAAQVSGLDGTLEVVELPDPEPGAGEVLVRVEACGIGLTVVKATREDGGRRPVKLPRVPGHELVGTIVEAGPGVDPARVGERTLAYYYLACGRCRACLRGSESLCENQRGNVGVAIDGGYAELALLPSFNALPVPAEIDSVEATVITDAVATPVHVARRAAIAHGERVAVIGAGGGVGIHMAQVARAYGADVAGLDIASSKLEYLERELGIAAFDSSDFDSVQLPPPWSGKADVVVDFVGRPESLAWALRSLDGNGRLVCLTSTGAGEVSVSPRLLVSSQLSVMGSRYTSRHETGLAGSLLATGHVRPVISRRVGIDEVESVHEELRQGTLLGRAALVWA